MSQYSALTEDEIYNTPAGLGLDSNNNNIFTGSNSEIDAIENKIRKDELRAIGQGGNLVSKRDKLNNAAKDRAWRMRNLQGNNMGEGTTNIGGKTYMNKNKTYNNISDVEYQTLFSNVNDGQWQRRPDGTYYTIDSSGNEVEQDPNKAGVLYFGKTADGAVKLGFVKNFKNQSQTAIDAVKANYNNFGTHPNANPTMDPNMYAIFGDIDTIKNFEAISHGRDKALADRKWDLVNNEQSKDPNNPGSRRTEVYNSAEGVLGDTSNAKLDNSWFSQDMKISDAAKYMEDIKDEHYIPADSGDDSIAKSVAYGVVQLAVDVADVALDAVATKKDSGEQIGMIDAFLKTDKFGNSTLLDNAGDRAAKIVGYDRTTSNEAQQEVLKLWKSGNYLDMAGKIATTPQIIGEQVANFGAMIIPIPGIRVGAAAKAAQRLKKLEKALEIAKTSKKTKNIAKISADIAKESTIIAKNNSKALDILNGVAKKAGFHALTVSIANNVIEDRVKNKNDDLTFGEYLSVYGSTYALMLLDAELLGKIVKIPKGKESAITALSMANKDGKIAVAKEVAKRAAKMSASVAGAGAGEGVQEYLQQWGEILGASLATEEGSSVTDPKEWMKILSDAKNQDDTTLAGIIGMAVSGELRVGVETIGQMKSGANSLSGSKRQDSGSQQGTTDVATDKFQGENALEFTQEELDALSGKNIVVPKYGADKSEVIAEIKELDTVLTNVENGLENNPLEAKQAKADLHNRLGIAYDRLANIKRDELITANDGLEKSEIEDKITELREKAGSHMTEFANIANELEQDRQTGAAVASFGSNANFSMAINENGEVEDIYDLGIGNKPTTEQINDALSALDGLGSDSDIEYEQRILDENEQDNINESSTSKKEKKKQKKENKKKKAEAEIAQLEADAKKLKEIEEESEAKTDSTSSGSKKQNKTKYSKKAKASAKKIRKKIEKKIKQIRTTSEITDDILYGDDSGIFTGMNTINSINDMISEYRKEYIAEGLIEPDDKRDLDAIYDGLTDEQKTTAVKIRMKLHSNGSKTSVPYLYNAKKAILNKYNQSKNTVDSKINSLQSTVEKMESEIIKEAADLVENGVESGIARDEDGNAIKDEDGNYVGKKIEFKNHDEAIKYLIEHEYKQIKTGKGITDIHGEYKFKDVYIGGKKAFQINYKNVAENMLDGKARNGVYKLIEQLQNEKKAVDSIIVDENGNVTLTQEVQNEINKRLESKLKKEAEAKAKEKIELVDKVMSENSDDTEYKSYPKQEAKGKDTVEKLEAKIEKIDSEIKEIIAEAKKDINEQQNPVEVVFDRMNVAVAGVKTFQDEFLKDMDKVEEIDKSSEELRKRELELKRKLKNQNKRLEKIKQELEAVYKEKGTNDGEVKQILDNEISKDGSKTARAKRIRAGILAAANKLSRLVRGTGKLIKEYAQLIVDVRKANNELKAIDAKLIDSEIKVSNEEKRIDDKYIKEDDGTDSLAQQYAEEKNKIAKNTKKINREKREKINKAKGNYKQELDELIKNNPIAKRNAKIQKRISALQKSMRKQGGSNTASEYKSIVKQIRALKGKLSTPIETAKLLQQQADKQKSERIHQGSGKDAVAVPTQINTYATVARSSGNLLNSVDIEELKTISTDEGVWDVGDHVDEGNDFFNSDVIDTKSKEGTDYGIIDSPFVDLIKDKDGNISDMAKAAVSIVGFGIIHRDGGSLFTKTDKQIETMLGLSPGELTSEMASEFRHKTRLYILASKYGTEILSMMGIKEIKSEISDKRHGNQEAYARLRASAGLVVLKFLEYQEVIEPIDAKNTDAIKNRYTLDEYNQILGKEGNKTDSGTTGKEEVVFVSTINYKPVWEPMSEIDDEKTADRLAELENGVESIEDTEDMLDIEVQSKTYLTMPPKIKTAEDYRVNEFTLPSERQVAGLNAIEQTENNVVVETVADMIADIGDPRIDEKAREKILKLMGWNTLESMEDDGISSDEYERMEARNIEKETELDELMKIYTKIENGEIDNALWFEYKTSIMGRQYITSVGIDNQTNKEMQRWLVAPSDATKEYSVDEIDKIIEDMANGKKPTNDNQITFLMGIAQAFNEDIDKQDPSISVAKAKELMDKTQDELLDMITEVLDEDGSKNFDHIGHAMIARSAIKAYNEAKASGGSKTFTASISAEYDGITDGVIRKLMQFPHGEHALALMAKGGIITEEGLYDSIMLRDDGTTEEQARKEAKQWFKDFKGMASEIGEKRIIDIYVTQAMKTDLAADKLVKAAELEDEKDRTDFMNEMLNYDNGSGSLLASISPQKGDLGEITKAMRDLFKDPTMVTQYGATIKNAIKNMSKILMNKLVGEMLVADRDGDKDSAGYKTLEILAKEMGKTPENLANEMREEALGKIYPAEGHGDGMTVEELLMDMYINTVGVQMKTTLEEILGPVIAITELMNQSNRYAYKIFEQKIREEFDKKQKELKPGQVNMISLEDVNKVIKDNKKLLPLIIGPAGGDKLETGLVLFAEKVADLYIRQYEHAKVSGQGGEGKAKKVAARGLIKTIAEGYALAGVLGTQNEDALQMGDILVQAVQERLGVLGVHDALVVPGKDGKYLLQSYNKGTAEVSAGFSQIDAITDMLLDIMVEAGQDGLPDTEKGFDSGKELLATTMKASEDMFAHKMKKIWSVPLKIDHMPGYDTMIEFQLTDKQIDEMFEAEINKRLGRMEKLTDTKTDVKVKKNIVSMVNSIKDINKRLEALDAMSNMLDGKDC